MSTRPLAKRKIFPFTSLPAELKNQIYALALTDKNGIFLISKTKRYRRTVQRSAPTWKPPIRLTGDQVDPTPPPEIPPSALVPNILFLNRAIFAETQPVLYAGNTFALEDTTAMHAFLAIIGPKNRATLTDLTIKGWGYTKAHKALNHPAFTLLAGAVNLTRLHLDCQIAWGGPRRVAKQLYRDTFHWLETVGTAKGKFDAAMDFLEVPDDTLIGLFRGPLSIESLEEKREEFKAELRKLLR